MGLGAFLALVFCFGGPFLLDSLGGSNNRIFRGSLSSFEDMTSKVQDCNLGFDYKGVQ